VTLIEDLVARARERARGLSREEPRSAPRTPSFLEAIRGKDRLDVIAEFKKKSPSLGAIADRELEARVKRYEEAGASAVSVLTEPTRFAGSFEDLERAARTVDIPVLMKDFVVDLAQVRVAARLGARAVLLIVRCLERAELEELVSCCAHYGLTPLVECHSEREIEESMRHEGVVTGVNNRDLDTLAIDRSLAPRLLGSVPTDRVVVAESGYESGADVSGVRRLADAVLVGSALMKLEDPAKLIEEIRG
jgi:indole-3-glycerol phosphate synthase